MAQEAAGSESKSVVDGEGQWTTVASSSGANVKANANDTRCVCLKVLKFPCESFKKQPNAAIVTDQDGKQYPEFLWCPHCKCPSRRLWWCHSMGCNRLPDDWEGFACAEIYPAGIRDCKPRCTFLPKSESESESGSTGSDDEDKDNGQNSDADDE
jgi:hypothetical protein